MCACVCGLRFDKLVGEGEGVVRWGSCTLVVLRHTGEKKGAKGVEKQQEEEEERRKGQPMTRGVSTYAGAGSGQLPG